ncbi:MAG: tetratricopeptide repeat protein, partial [Methanomassiliicoccales archaeon]
MMMPFDLEYGCKYLINFIVSKRTAKELSEKDFSQIPQAQKLVYINQLMDLGWIVEQKSSLTSDYVVYAFSDKGRRIFENPAEIISLSDAEQEHISLLRKLDAARRDDDLLSMPSILLSLAEICFGVARYDSALVYAMEMQSISERIRSSYYRAESLLLLGKIDNARGELESALKSYVEGSSLFKQLGEISREADALRLAGGILLKMGHFKQALNYFNESKGACMSVRYLRGVAKIEINLGILNSLAGSYDTAEKLWTHALEFFRSVGDEQTVALILNNIGGMMVLRRKFESAAANFK